MSDAQSCSVLYGSGFGVCYTVTACILDPYHVSPEGFDGHYEHKKEHKCIEDSLETLWFLSTKSSPHSTSIS